MVYSTGVAAIAAAPQPAPSYLLHCTWHGQLAEEAATVTTRFNGGAPLPEGGKKRAAPQGCAAFACLAVRAGPAIRSFVEANTVRVEVCPCAVCCCASCESTRCMR